MIYKLVFLCSGNGGNMKFIYHFFAERYNTLLNIEITNVIVDRDCGAMHFAIKNNIKCNIHSFKRNESEDEILVKLIEDNNPDLIITNVNKILSRRIVNRFSGKLINLHYSLLPSFGGHIGMKSLELAIQQGCKFIGATVHHVTDGLDMGAIICQGIFTVEHTDDLISTMFKTGSISLLNGIAKTLDISTLPNQDYNNIIFSPSTELDCNFLDRIFLML